MFQMAAVGPDGEVTGGDLSLCPLSKEPPPRRCEPAVRSEELDVPSEEPGTTLLNVTRHGHG